MTANKKLINVYVRVEMADDVKDQLIAKFRYESDAYRFTKSQREYYKENPNTEYPIVMVYYH